MIDDTNTEAEDAVTEEVTDAPAQPGLNIQDLATLRNIINVASSRGAFKPEEFTVVGNTYNKLDGFINSIAPQMAEAEADSAEEVDAPVTDEVEEEAATEE